MSEDREAFSPHFAVTHELTDEGLMIVADQVVTADAVTGLPIDNPPLGELVHYNPEEGGGEAEMLPEEAPIEEPTAEELAEEDEPPVETQSFGQSF